MQTTDQPATTTGTQRPQRAPAYYLGRSADVWLAMRRPSSPPKGGAGRPVPAPAHRDRSIRPAARRGPASRLARSATGASRS